MVDRTNEFVSLAESYWKDHPTVAPARIRPRAAIALQAAALAAQIKRAAALVTRLRLLARRRALFDDPAAEINDLVPRIKAELQAANGALGDFLSACTSQSGGDPRATVTGALACTSRAHWTLVGEVLREKAVSVAGVLQDALSTRARNLQEHSARRRQIARSNFVPTVQQADSPLWTALQPPQLQQPQPFAGDDGAGGGAARGMGLRSRRPAVIPLAPPTHSPRAGGVQPAPAGRPPAGPFSRGHQLPASVRSPPVGLSVTATVPLAARPVGVGGSGAYSYSAQEVAQYHSASNRLEEQLAVESAVVEIGTGMGCGGLMGRHINYTCLLLCVARLASGHMMTSLASLVGEQGELVNRIDNDMDIA